MNTSQENENQAWQKCPLLPDEAKTLSFRYTRELSKWFVNYVNKHDINIELPRLLTHALRAGGIERKVLSVEDNAGYYIINEEDVTIEYMSFPVAKAVIEGTK